MTIQSSTSAKMTRREFLYCVWAASLALFTAETGRAILWFALPRFKPGEFGSTFTILIDKLPSPDSPPIPYDEGRFWLVNIGSQAQSDPLHPTGYSTQLGVMALYKVCVHLGCLYRWEPILGRFKCPCHASQYLLDGTRIQGPASRDLDRFVLRFVDENGETLAATVAGDTNTNSAVGQGVVIPSKATAIVVDTGKRIRGRTNDGPNTAPPNT